MPANVWKRIGRVRRARFAAGNETALHNSYRIYVLGHNGHIADAVVPEAPYKSAVTREAWMFGSWSNANVGNGRFSPSLPGLP